VKEFKNTSLFRLEILKTVTLIPLMMKATGLSETSIRFYHIT